MGYIILSYFIIFLGILLQLTMIHTKKNSTKKILNQKTQNYFPQVIYLQEMKRGLKKLKKLELPHN
jgi:hypothetical protein